MAFENNNSTNLSQLRFGILYNGQSLQKWQVKSIQLLIKNNIKPVLVIADNRPVIRKSFFQYLLNYQYSKFLFRFYHRFIFKPEAKKISKADDLLKDVHVLNCIPETKGFSEYFTQEDIDEIKSYKLDFILRFGFNIIRGEILSAAKFGVWSFHHDDEKKYRGGPPGFWEIYNNDDINGVIFQELNDKLDGGIILRKGYFKTVKHSYTENLNQLLSESSIFPLQVCNNILNGKDLFSNSVPSKTDAKIYRVPGNLKMLFFLFKLFFNKIFFHFNELFKAEKWNIGVVKMSPDELLYTDSEITPNWCPEPANNYYYADPFAIEHENEVEIFFEYYNYKITKGNISRMTYDKINNAFSDITTVIEKKSHLSYPYIFNNKNVNYCIPETANDNCIQLYKLINNNTVPYKLLIDNVSAVDTSTIFYQNKWWLFFTKKENSAIHLYIYFSDKLDGDYHPHKNNPVKSDVQSSRPAGNIFQHKNELYRPSQDCSKTYGGKIALNKIIKLTDTSFEEVTIKHINPFNNTKFNKGVHTMTITKNYIVFDAKKMVFITANFTNQLKEKLRRLVNR